MVLFWLRSTKMKLFTLTRSRITTQKFKYPFLKTSAASVDPKKNYVHRIIVFGVIFFTRQYPGFSWPELQPYSYKCKEIWRYAFSTFVSVKKVSLLRRILNLLQLAERLLHVTYDQSAVSISGCVINEPLLIKVAFSN